MRKPFMKKTFRPKSLIMPVLMTMLTIPAFAQQEITLEEAVEMAMKNCPRLKSAEAAINVARAERGASWEVGHTALDYSWGQLNSPITNDRQLTITQPLGSVITPFYKNALVRRQVATGQHFRDIVKKEITAEVTRAWVYYLYSRNLVQMYRELNNFAEQLLRTGELRHQAGDITLLERNMIATQAATMRSRVFHANEEYRIAAARLQWACFSDTPVVPTDTALTLTLFPLNNGQLGEAYSAYFNSLADEMQAQINVERSRLFPELSAGFIQQNIFPDDRGLKAWTIGVSAPLFFAPQRTRIKQARLNAEIARYDAQHNIRELNIQMETLRADLRRYTETVLFYETSALPEANALIRSAQLQLEHHDTDISQFIQSMNAALEIKQAHAEAVYQYHVTMLELQLYQ
jgi:cobalt-zinc-cadmium resistance protein CzcA